MLHALSEISSLWNVVQPLTAFTRTDCELFAIPCKEFNAILAVMYPKTISLLVIHVLVWLSITDDDDDEHVDIAGVR